MSGCEVISAMSGYIAARAVFLVFVYVCAMIDISHVYIQLIKGVQGFFKIPFVIKMYFHSVLLDFRSLKITSREVTGYLLYNLYQS